MNLTQKECIEIIAKKLSSLDVSLQDAENVANVLIEAELRKDPSHGIKCLLKIIDEIKKGNIIPNKKPKIITEEKAMAIIDGENVLGPIVGIEAMKLAIQKAKEYGVAVVSTRKSHHLFTIGYYTKLAALNNMIGILTTSTAPAIFAPGGLEKVLGTNPISIAIPSEDNPIIVDMSSTNVARGKIQEAAKTGKKIPLNWALNEQGKPTDDPNQALEGSIRTIGNYKGFALALVIDILSGILSGSASGKEVFGTSMHLDNENKKTAYKGDFFIVIDPSKFSEIKLFKSRVSKLINDIKNSKKINETEEIHIPGETAHKNKDKLIEIDDKLYQEILEL